MAMKYKELREKYPIAYEALKTHNKTFIDKSHDNINIGYACPWSKTPEGSNFWRKMDLNTKKSIEAAKLMQPQLFEAPSILNSTEHSTAMLILTLTQ